MPRHIKPRIEPQNKVLLICLLFIAMLVLMLIGSYAIAKHEAMECKRWAEQSAQYPGFYYTDWQKEMCKIDN